MKNETNLQVFEVVGNSMNDGTRFSFEAGYKLIVQPFSISDFRNSIGNDLNSFWIIEIEKGILFRQIVKYDMINDTIECHSLNTTKQDLNTFIKIGDITKPYRVVQLQSKTIHYGEP